MYYVEELSAKDYMFSHFLPILFFEDAYSPYSQDSYCQCY